MGHSWSVHIPRLQVRFLVGAYAGDNWLMILSLPLTLSLTLRSINTSLVRDFFFFKESLCGILKERKSKLSGVVGWFCVLGRMGGDEVSVQNLLDHYSNFGFCSKWNREPLNGFEQICYLIWLLFLKDHSDCHVENTLLEGKGGSRENGRLLPWSIGKVTVT